MYQVDTNTMAAMTCVGFNVNMDDLATLVYTERKRRGWTQDDLGALIGVGGQTIYNLEKGRTSTLKLGNLRKLAEVFEMPFESLPKQNTSVIPPAIREALVQAAKEQGIPPRQLLDNLAKEIEKEERFKISSITQQGESPNVPATPRIPPGRKAQSNPPAARISKSK